MSDPYEEGGDLSDLSSQQAQYAENLVHSEFPKFLSEIRQAVGNIIIWEEGANVGLIGQAIANFLGSQPGTHTVISTELAQIRNQVDSSEYGDTKHVYIEGLNTYEPGENLDQFGQINLVISLKAGLWHAARNESNFFNFDEKVPSTLEALQILLNKLPENGYLVIDGGIKGSTAELLKILIPPEVLPSKAHKEINLGDQNLLIFRKDQFKF